MAEPWRWLDPIPAEVLWVGDGLQPWAQCVGSVIRPGFEAYARVLHPIELDHRRRISWSQVARDHGRLVHPAMQFHLIATPAGQRPADLYDAEIGQVDWGSLPAVERAILADVVARYTRSSTCWVAAWDGWGCLDDPSNVEARLRLPNRHYLVAEDELELAITSVCGPPGDQSPSLWWPKDRSWLVATEIDFAWTYVGGSRALVDELLATPGLEALETALHHRPQADSDLLNEALNGDGAS